MTSRSKLVRGGAAVVGASVALMLSAALPAGADPATGKVDPNGYTSGYNINVGGDNTDIKPSLIGFTLDGDGGKLQMYCVEIETSIDKKHAMVEKPWDSFPNADSPFHKNRDKINWVLHNGYPVVGTDALTKVLTDAGVEVNDGIDKPEAISATQAAVWHFSDGVDLNEEEPVPNASEEINADVMALYEYLTGEANVGIGDQPTAALEITPADLSGEAGKRVGPFTVNTTGAVEKLTTELPEGVKLVDANGVEVTAEQIANGAQLFLDVPAGAEGSGSFELTATAGVDTGRLFVGQNYDEKPTQSLIVATSEKSEIVAKAAATWTATPAPTTTTTPAPTTDTTTPAPTTETTTPAPQPKNTNGELADTGASILAPVIIGVVLVGAGIGALFFQRHRRRA